MESSIIKKAIKKLDFETLEMIVDDLELSEEEIIFILDKFLFFYHDNSNAVDYWEYYDILCRIVTCQKLTEEMIIKYEDLIFSDAEIIDSLILNQILSVKVLEKFLLKIVEYDSYFFDSLIYYHKENILILLFINPIILKKLAKIDDTELVHHIRILRKNNINRINCQLLYSVIINLLKKQ